MEYGMWVRDWMREPALSVDENCSIEHAGALMRTSKTEHLPVLGTNGALLGVIDAVQVLSVGDAAEPVHLHMTESTLAIHPDAPVEVAAAILRSESRTAVPVAEAGYIRGVFSRSDALRALSALESQRIAPEPAAA
ncbi:MAG: CBS domain-containing protein [Myxococcota bacterium]